MTTLTPDQLPNSSAQFIAYGAPERVADPLGGDEAINIRPQVFVRYYRGIKIKDLRTPNDDTVNVVFDPASVGLEKAFGAYMNSDDRVVAYIREQFEAGKPVDIGIEYQRRKKTKKEKQGISPLPPIHALRGASNPDGTGDNGAMLGKSGNNTHSKLALVNGRRTTVVQSDPREWAGLVSNTQGDLPPAGWKVLIDKEDWSRLGVITPKGDAPFEQAAAPQQGGMAPGLDMNVLSKIIGNEVRKGLKEYGENLLRQDDAENGTTTGKAVQSSVEGKPWTVWINKDQMNLGSFLVAGESHALRWAFTYLGGLGDDVLNKDDEIRWEAARELADASQKIADKVQATAYNGGVRADRTSASFKEAVLWVRFHIEHSYPFSAAEDFDYDSWFTNVGRSATNSLKTSEALAQGYLDERYPKASNETKQQGTPSGKPVDSQSHMVSAYLQLLSQKWNDRDGVFALAKEANQKNLLDTTVWANPYDGKFSTEPFDGGRELTIGDLTKNQYTLLSQTADATPEEEPPAQEPNEQETERPQQTEATPTQEAASTLTAQHVAARLSKATTEKEIADSYNAARAANLLTAEISVLRGAGTFGISPVRPGSDGAETMTLGAAFDALREAIDTPQDSGNNETAPSKEKEPAPEPASTPEPQNDDAATNEGHAEASEQAGSGDDDNSATDDSAALAQDIAERGLKAKSAEEVKALIAEAKEAGVSEATVSVRGGNGLLSGFLDSRLQRASRPDN